MQFYDLTSTQRVSVPCLQPPCHTTASHAGLCPLCGSYDVAYYLRSPPAGDVFVKVHRVDDQETRSLGRVLTLDNIHVRLI